MATNKDPFVYSKSKDGKPDIFLGLVQAGSDQEIKVGEICTWNDTTDYFVPVTAIADHRYPLAIAKEEQKATGRAELTAIRYIEFYSLDPNDVFEFQLTAARTLVLGDPFTLHTDSQYLVYGAGAFAVAISVDYGNYPQEEDTTIRKQSYARVTFNPAVSYYGFRLTQAQRAGRRVIAVSSGEAFKESDMYNTLVLMSGSFTITLPAVKPGMDVIFVNADAGTQIIDPDGTNILRVDGASLGSGTSMTQTDQGYWCQVITEDAGGFLVLSTPGQWGA